MNKHVKSLGLIKFVIVHFLFISCNMEALKNTQPEEENQNINCLSHFGDLQDPFAEYVGEPKELHKVPLDVYYTSSDEDLLYSFVDNTGYYSRMFKESPEKISDYSPYQKGLNFWRSFDAQVQNGGIGQFYFNYGTETVPAIIKGLCLMDAKEMAFKLYEYHSRYLKSVATKGSARDRGMWGSDMQLSGFDSFYYKNRKELIHQVVSYIRKNPGEFFLDNNGNEILGNYTGTFQKFNKEGNVSWQVDLKEGIPNGYFKSFGEGNLSRSTKKFVDGNRTGDESYYRQDGTPAWISELDSSNQVVTKKTYYENGNLRQVHSSFLNAQRSYIGEYQEYFENGQLSISGNYPSAEKPGDTRFVKIGTWLKYYKSGQVKLESRYVKRKEQLVNFWNEDGVQKMHNGTGFCIEEKTIGREIHRTEGHYVDFERNGQVNVYKGEILISTTEYDNGLKNGNEIIYYDTGKVKEKSWYENGTKISGESFNLFEEPKVMSSIVVRRPEYPFFKKIDPFPTSQIQVLNKAEILKTITCPVSTMEKVTNYKETVSISTMVNESGNVFRANAKFGSGTACRSIALKLVKALKFNPIVFKGETVRCDYAVDVTFELVKGKEN